MDFGDTSMYFRIKRTPLLVDLSLLDQPHPAEIYVPTFVHNDIMYQFIPHLILCTIPHCLFLSQKSTACARSAAIWSPEKNCDLNFYAFTDC